MWVHRAAPQAQHRTYRAPLTTTHTDTKEHLFLLPASHLLIRYLSIRGCFFGLIPRPSSILKSTGLLNTREKQAVMRKVEKGPNKSQNTAQISARFSIPKGAKIKNSLLKAAPAHPRPPGLPSPPRPSRSPPPGAPDGHWRPAGPEDCRLPLTGAACGSAMAKKRPVATVTDRPPPPEALPGQPGRTPALSPTGRRRWGREDTPPTRLLRPGSAAAFAMKNTKVT